MTGRPLWTWTSPPVGPGAWASLAVVAAARDGNLVLLAGQIGPPPAATQFTARLPSPLQWPAVLGPSDEESPVLALDAATGHPRWTELSGQQESFTLSGGAACEMVNTGLECRDDVTGSPTLPVLVTGQPVSASPPYGDDQLAGISGGIAAVTTAPFRSGNVTVRVIAVRSGVTVAQVRLDIGTHAYGGANYQVFVTAAGTLPGGAVLALVRRIDVAGFPVVALRIQPPQPR